MAGLITGDTYYADDKAYTVEVAAPVMPDISEVRAAVDAAFGDDEPAPTAVPARRRASSPGIRVPRETPGMMPTNPRAGRPRSPAVRQLAGLRARKPAERIPPPKGATRRKPGSSAGAVVAVLVVFGFVVWIVISIVASLLDFISNILN